MISYTQRSPTSETLAHALYCELRRRGLKVWLDVKMLRRDEAAMKEGVQNSRGVIAIVSGPVLSSVVGESDDDASYFKREFCLKELRWAQEAQVFIQPVVVAEDKSKITALFNTIPVGFDHLKAVNWEHLDYKDAEYFELGAGKVLRGCGLLK